MEASSSSPAATLVKRPLPQFCLGQIHEEVNLEDDFEKPSSFRNTRIVLRSTGKPERSFYVCGVLLAEASKFFAEKLEDDDNDIIIDEASDSSFLLLLRAVHPCTNMTTVNASNCCVLALYSIKYEFRQLHGECQRSLAKHIDTIPDEEIQWLFENFAKERGPKPWLLQLISDRIARTFDFDKIDALEMDSDVARVLYRLCAVYANAKRNTSSCGTPNTSNATAFSPLLPLRNIKVELVDSPVPAQRAPSPPQPPVPPKRKSTAPLEEVKLFSGLNKTKTSSPMVLNNKDEMTEKYKEQPGLKKARLEKEKENRAPQLTENSSPEETDFIHSSSTMRLRKRKPKTMEKADKEETLAKTPKNSKTADIPYKHGDFVFPVLKEDLSYTCVICKNYSCAEWRSMLRHTRTYHNSTIGWHQCTGVDRKCLSYYATKEELEHHVRTIHEGQNVRTPYTKSTVAWYICGQCQERFKSENSVKAHAIQAHNSHTSNSRYGHLSQSGGEEAESPTANTQQRKLAYTGGKELYTCRYCNQKFPNRGFMLSHIKISHKSHKSQPSPHQSSEEVDEKAVDLIDELKGAVTFECVTCKEMFQRRVELKQHLVAIHQAENADDTAYRAQRVCKECRATFRSLTALNSHYATKHLNEKAFTCHQCSETFKRADLFRFHQFRVHQVKSTTSESAEASQIEVLKFPCSQCGQFFARRNKLAAHLQDQHKSPDAETEAEAVRFTCEFCHLTTDTHAQLIAHRHSVHPGELKEEKCELCGLEFARREQYMRHKRTKHFNGGDEQN